MKFKITIEYEIDYADTEWQAVHQLDTLLRHVLSSWKIIKVEKIKEA